MVRMGLGVGDRKIKYSDSHPHPDADCFSCRACPCLTCVC